MNPTILSVIQIIISILLVVTILLQQKGSGAGSAFGGSGGASYHTMRGFEKILFIATIVLGVIFVLSAVAALFIAR